MRLSFVGVRRWLEENAGRCSEQELHTLAAIIEEALPKAIQRSQAIKEKLDKIVELAKQAGLDERAVAKLVASSKPALTPVDRAPRSSVRRPYMNPFDVKSGIYAFPPNHPEKMPEWAKKALADGWAKEEMHYKNIGKAWAKRNMTALYDPVARHAELQAEEQARGGYQRQKK